MTLQDRLNEDLKTAMRSKDIERRSVIRLLRSAIHNAEITKQATLDDEAVTQVLTKQAQQRRESIEAYGSANRQDLVDKETAELAIIMEYLPEQMSREDISQLVRQALEDVSAQGPQDMGKVMGKLMPQVHGKAIGSEVSSIVMELLKDLAD